MKALEAAFDGMRVRELHERAARGGRGDHRHRHDGCDRRGELGLVRDGVLLANAGHFSEIDAGGARPGHDASPSTSSRHGRIRLLGRGEMLNLTAATGNQIQVMDLGFALQAHSLRELARDPGAVPSTGRSRCRAEIDDAVARGDARAARPAA